MRKDTRVRRICVFAGSNAGVRPEYAEAAQALGRELCRRGIGAVYGGAAPRPAGGPPRPRRAGRRGGGRGVARRGRGGVPAALPDSLAEERPGVGGKWREAPPEP